MRLVSACWAEFSPFHLINGVNSHIGSSDPNDLKPGDVLIVWGGGDIHPSLYNKMMSSKSGAYETPSQRDMTEWTMMQRARELNIPIIGVCRGAQMLCALVGGYLIQHVENHGGTHEVTTYDNKQMMVNSIHHQMLYPFDVQHEMIAWASPSRSRIHLDVDTDVDMPLEPEFVYFPQVEGFAIQWHPEMLPIDCTANKYVLKFINERISENVYA